MLRLAPPIWTLIYLLLCAVLSWLLEWPMIPRLPLPPLGMALVVLAFIQPVWAFILFRREDTEINPTSPANRTLVTRGPYHFTRNPMYLGLVALSLGIAIWVGARPMFLAPLAVFVTVNWIHIPFEEAKMRRQFGAAYDDYVAQVRRWV
jgi:protein-S-isoprenylcysteine O-methyltransferase Ste14